jgi:hypothetical protein
MAYHLIEAKINSLSRTLSGFATENKKSFLSLTWLQPTIGAILS